MIKSTITRTFIGSLFAFVAGLLLAVFATLAALSSGVLIMEGPDVAGFEASPFAWWMVGLVVIGGLAMVGGAIGGLVAWIGALLNTADLEDKTWFILLLVLGILSFGLFAMIAYVIAGPDGKQPHISGVSAGERLTA